ncbi:hypothetical protein K435DRAFT_753303 [Dendrothele bispora CBS 962.96]|uniref:NmrA-like domain-containing protein n=1 Tax=Dendrothele bispora (strain CBS 962.96) TaxID=1314807 RepID=A0A4S8M8B1_DENBC|nr:hypothetical protein K435DRAFT_753303 [Dendrothele bispora CBS 962.96]
MAQNSATYKSFAILGNNGSLSPWIIDALAKQPGVTTLIVLSRSAPSPASSKPLPSPAKLVQADYDNHDSLVQIFKEYTTDVVISTVGQTVITDTQKKAASAAKDAGVKLFFPSEYGVVTYGLGGKGQGFMSEKDEFSDFLTLIELPYARVFTGIWLRWIPWLTGLDANGKINILKGKGDTPISTTAEEDISGFIAYVCTNLSPSELANARFRLEGERLTTKQIVSRLNKPLEYVDIIPGEASEVRTTVATECEHGAGSTGWNHDLNGDNDPNGPEGAGSGNRFWKGHVWKKIEDVLQL